MSNLYSEVLKPYVPPKHSEVRTVRSRGGTLYQVNVRTEKLLRAPWYKFSVHFNGEVILELISNPGVDDILQAITKHQAAVVTNVKKGRVHDTSSVE